MTAALTDPERVVVAAADLDGSVAAVDLAGAARIRGHARNALNRAYAHHWIEPDPEWVGYVRLTKQGRQMADFFSRWSY